MSFVGNLVLVTEFLKSIKTWRSFRQSSATNFNAAVSFGPRYANGR